MPSFLLYHRIELMNQFYPIKKAVIPTAGMGTRFLPISKLTPKELLPLADKPLIQYLVEEAYTSGIREIIFITQPGKRMVLDYFTKTSKKIEKIIKERKKEELLERLKKLEELSKNISFSSVPQREPQGDGHAVLVAKKLVGEENFAVLFSDDIVESDTPCLMQMSRVFKTCQRPVIALHKIAKESLPFYGVVKEEKIANRLYKIKGLVEKPKVEEAPSDLAVVGKYIFTPEIFDYLKKTPPNEKKEVILADALMNMAKDGKLVYGYEFEGEWWECGNIRSYLKTNFYFSLRNPEFGPELKQFLRGYL